MLDQNKKGITKGFVSNIFVAPAQHYIGTENLGCYIKLLNLVSTQIIFMF